MKSFDINEYLLTREIELTNDDNFTIIMETLERIGMISLHNKTLFQSCHILQKKGKLYIVHFKEMYALDGKYSSMTLEDVAIRNLISILLERWGLIKLVNPINDEPVAEKNSIHIISHNDKKNWKLQTKYTFKSLRK